MPAIVVFAGVQSSVAPPINVFGFASEKAHTPFVDAQNCDVAASRCWLPLRIRPFLDA